MVLRIRSPPPGLGGVTAAYEAQEIVPGPPSWNPVVISAWSLGSEEEALFLMLVIL